MRRPTRDLSYCHPRSPDAILGGRHPCARCPELNHMRLWQRGGFVTCLLTLVTSYTHLRGGSAGDGPEGKLGRTAIEHRLQRGPPDGRLHQKVSCLCGAVCLFHLSVCISCRHARDTNCTTAFHSVVSPTEIQNRVNKNTRLTVASPPSWYVLYKITACGSSWASGHRWYGWARQCRSQHMM